ncbi:hypothetical protein K4F52_004125 [Lecanicillium sp. MT-2017a]|nr:hypothetical protein K4F52_004125 [Lecanicillium sp. MT-2017a]
MLKPNFGIKEKDRLRLEASVTVIIHAAADISLKASLRSSVATNCLPSLELARLSSNFVRLQCFVQVSSLYALSFLPDGEVEERLYHISDPEGALRSILAGDDVDFDAYAWAYARAKHITECLLTARNPKLPLLILRPSSIGPALFEPFELYGKQQSIPIDAFYSRLMTPAQSPHTFLATRGSTSGTNILDEIPVDLVANVLLQHVEMGTRGPVHANCRFYTVKSFDDFVRDVNTWVPNYWKLKLSPVAFTTDEDAELCQIARFYGMATRNWIFMSSRSDRLLQHGTLGVSLEGHNAEAYTKARIQRVLRDMERWRNKRISPKI